MLEGATTVKEAREMVIAAMKRMFEVGEMVSRKQATMEDHDRARYEVERCNRLLNAVQAI